MSNYIILNSTQIKISIMLCVVTTRKLHFTEFRQILLANSIQYLVAFMESSNLSKLTCWIEKKRILISDHHWKEICECFYKFRGFSKYTIIKVLGISILPLRLVINEPTHHYHS